MTAALTAALAVAALCAAWLGWQARRRHVALWLPSYLRGDWAGRRQRRARRRAPTVHVLFCVADHFEPAVGGPGIETERARLEHWLERYPAMAGKFRDADGRPPRHTFFFPAEQYRREHLERLAELARAGWGEVEVHLHHDGDTSEGLRRTLSEFVQRLRAHGHLGADPDGRARFAFVHGNWALDNSHPDGRWCGVNDELRVLRQCGCYADFTMPSAPSPTQTRRINSIYRATDDPARPRSHDDGAEARADGEVTGDLLLIQGPLGLRWPGRFGVLPRIENGSVDGVALPTPRRVDAWVRAGVSVEGRPEWVFVKVYSHGAREGNWPALLGPPAEAMHRHLQQRYNDGVRHRLHYVSAREMYNIVRAAERGLSGDPGRYRDLEIAPPTAAEPGAVTAPRARSVPHG